MELLLRLAGFAICVYVCQSVDSNTTGVALEDGASLTRMGRVFDNPLFRMLGHVFTNTENLVNKAKVEIFEDLCALHPCSPWTKWSDCSAIETSTFGIKTRSRQCGVDSPFCIQPHTKNEETSIEKDTEICDGGGCKLNYTRSSNGFCMQLYKTRLTKTNADAACQKEGAFVLNINNKTKSDDLHELLAANEIVSETIWIDGRRGSLSSPWSFQYESEPVWSNWYNGEPSDNTDEYCRVEERNPRKWCDRSCDRSYWFVCEVPRYH